jgi:hypothetical protein
MNFVVIAKVGFLHDRYIVDLAKLLWQFVREKLSNGCLTG